jgi:iron complex transport system substrate-binding protein
MRFSRLLSRSVFGLLAFLLCATLLCGCANSPQNPAPPAMPAAKKISFPRDDLGREVHLKAPAKRVVCIGPGATETIYALGAGAKLVGRDQISDYPKETSGVPIVGDYTGPFAEKVIAVKPDLVIVQGETYDKARADNWQSKIGVPVAILVPTSVDRVEQGINKIADWLDNRERLADVTKEFPSHQKAPGYMHARHWSVFYEVQRSPLWTAGTGTLMDSELRVLGWGNAASDVQSYKQLNVEVLLKRDPEFYIVASTQPDQKKTIAELRATPAIKNLTAVRKGRVVVVDADLVLRGGPRLPQGIKMLSAELSRLANRDMSELGVLKR